MQVNAAKQETMAECGRDVMSKVLEAEIED